MQRHRLAIALGLLAIGSGAPRAQAPAITVAQVTVAADKPGPAIASTMYGIFFEDINFAADGGLYPERIKNRSFEFPEALMGWKKSATPDAQGDVRDPDGSAVVAHEPALPAAHVAAPAATASPTTASGVSASRPGRSTSSPCWRAQISPSASLTVGIENARMEPFGRSDDRDGAGRVGRPSPRTITPPVTTTRGRFRVRLRRPWPGRPRHGVAVPRRHLEEPAERPARRPRAAAGRPEAGLPALPRRLHRRGPLSSTPATSGRRRSARRPSGRR